MAEIDQRLTDFLHAAMPFAGVLDIQAVSTSKDEALAEVSWAADRCTTNEILHGGYLMGVADTIGASLAIANLPEGAGTATIESKTNFLRGAGQGTFTVRATPVHVGRTTVVVQTDVTREDGKLITRTIQTQAVLQS